MADSKCVRQLGYIRVTALDDGFDDLPITVVVNIDEAGAAALAELAPGNDLLHPVFNAYLVETGAHMSALGQMRTLRQALAMSALAPADDWGRRGLPEGRQVARYRAITAPMGASRACCEECDGIYLLRR